MPTGVALVQSEPDASPGVVSGGKVLCEALEESPFDAAVSIGSGGRLCEPMLCHRALLFDVRPLACMVSACAVLSLSCREPNPRFSLGDTVTGAQADFVDEVSTSEGSTDASGGAQASETTAPSPATPTSATSGSQSTTTTTANGTPVTSSGTPTQDSSSDPLLPLCDENSKHCYAMNYNSDEKNYPVLAGDGPPLRMVVGEGSVSSMQESGASLFADFVRVDQSGRLRVDVEVPTGTGGAFGFDVTLRKIGCTLNEPCYLARTGGLVLQFDPAASEMRCLFFSSTSSETGRASTSISPEAINTVGCFGQGGSIHLLVNGEERTGTRPQPLESLSVRYNVGASSNAGVTDSMFKGDVGRFRYWTDQRKMLRVLKAGG